MSKLLLMFLLVALSASPSFSQEASADTDQITNELNFRLSMMQRVMNEAQNLDSGLELIEDQTDKLAVLTKDYREMVTSLNEFEKTEGGMQTGLALCLTKLDNFETRLSSDILMPHQLTALSSMVFKGLVREQGGDIVSTLAKYYSKKFALTKAQQTQMGKIKASVTSKVAKASSEYEEKLQQIASDAKTEIHSTLTPKQSAMLTELFGNAEQ